MDRTLYADGFEEAIVGIDYLCTPARVIYDKNKMVEILMEADDMTLEDAIEYLEYNVFCAYVVSELQSMLILGRNKKSKI